jgi:hypothetical protein
MQSLHLSLSLSICEWQGTLHGVLLVAVTETTSKAKGE